MLVVGHAREHSHSPCRVGGADRPVATVARVWIGVAVMVVGSLVVAEVGRRSSAGRLDRNYLIGLRTRATLQSDEAWRAAHLAGGRTLVVAGLASAALSVIAGIAGAVSGEDTPVGLLLVVAAVVLAGGAVIAGQRGVAAAMQVAAQGDHP